MTLASIALLNLRRRKAKAAFVLAGLVIGVSTVVGLISLIETMTQDINHKLEKYGANILVVPRTENLSLSYEGLSLGGVSFETREIPEADLAAIRTIKNAANVAAVGPLVLGVVEVAGQRVLLAGMDFSSARVLKPWWRIGGGPAGSGGRLKGQGSPPGPDGLLLGAEAAGVLGLKPGDKVEIKGRSLTVSGVLEPTGSQDDQLIFSRLALAQQILGKPGQVSMAEVAALCTACPIDEMVEQITKVLPGAKVMAIQQVVRGRMETLGHFRKFAYGVSLIISLVGGLVVLVTMMGSVRERTGEIGVFRAIGFRRSHVMRVVLTEAAIISALAGGLGYLIGLGLSWAALPVFGHGASAAPAVDPLLAGAAMGLALIIGLAASLYPAALAARLDPNQALRAL